MVARLEIEFRLLTALTQHGVLGRGIVVWEVRQQRQRAVQLGLGDLKLSVECFRARRNVFHRGDLFICRFAARLGGRDRLVGRVLFGAQRLQLWKQSAPLLVKFDHAVQALGSVAPFERSPHDVRFTAKAP